MKLYPINQVAETMDIQLAKELLEALIQDDPVYPWSPHNHESEAYFSQLEAELSLTESWTPEEMETNANDFFSTLERCWHPSPGEQIKASLGQKLEHKFPQEWLETIVNNAQELFLTSLSPIEQLIQCVKPLLSSWEEEDLQVFARPLVFAMRGNTDPAREQWHHKDSWEQLSPVEKVRLTMAIAQYTLTELKDQVKDNHE